MSASIQRIPAAPSLHRPAAAAEPARAAHRAWPDAIARDVLSLIGLGPDREVRSPFPAHTAVGLLWRDALASSRRPSHADRLWSAGRPLSEGINAHSTNTLGDLARALHSGHGYNWLEGDVRAAIDEPDQIEMRHEKAHEPGDNLTLEEWLEIGKASGRGLKLDIKEGKTVDGVIATIERVGIPHDRLMLNLSDQDMARYGPKLRQRFPGATLAINPATELAGKESGDGPYAAWQVERMIAQAKKLGGPATFVLRADKVTPAIVKRLEAHGSVSIWNEPFFGGVTDPEAERAKLKRWGVTGVIDLRKSYGKLEKIVNGAKLAWQYGSFYAERGVQAAGNALEKVADAGKKAWSATLGKLF